jgi:hypothetical protein
MTLTIAFYVGTCAKCGTFTKTNEFGTRIPSHRNPTTMNECHGRNAKNVRAYHEVDSSPNHPTVDLPAMLEGPRLPTTYSPKDK